MIKAMVDERPRTLPWGLFTFLLDVEGRRAVRYTYYFSIVLIQTDRPESNPFFRTVVELVRQSIRDTDLIGKMKKHHGLAVLLHDSDAAGAHGVGNRICERIANYHFHLKNCLGRRTVSVGGACFPTHSADTKSLLMTAVCMLAQARSMGGNRICLPEF